MVPQTRHDTHVIHRHSVFKVTHTHWHAWTPAETGVMDSGWLCVSVGISLILFFFFLGYLRRCVFMLMRVCVCERLFLADGRSCGPFCRVNGGRANQQRLLPLLRLLLHSHFSLLPHPSKSASKATSSLSSHPFLFCLCLYLFVYQRQRNNGGHKTNMWERVAKEIEDIHIFVRRGRLIC